MRPFARCIVCLLLMNISPVFAADGYQRVAGVDIIHYRIGLTLDLMDSVITGETGILVASDDVTALTRAIGGLLDDPEKRRILGEKGRSRYKNYFTADRMLENTQVLYSDLNFLPKGGN